jgi:hypothetical protein
MIRPASTKQTTHTRATRVASGSPQCFRPFAYSLHWKYLEVAPFAEIRVEVLSEYMEGLSGQPRTNRIGKKVNNNAAWKSRSQPNYWT